MNTYRIVEPFSGRTVAENKLRGDKTARCWFNGLLDRGVITGIPVKLQRRVMTDEQAAALPPLFSSGRKQTAWRSMGRQ